MSDYDAKEHIRLLQAQIEETKRASAASSRTSMLTLEETMCDKFRILREEHGWSQKDLAERMVEYGFDFHQSTIAKLENHTRPLRVAEMFALSHIFKMPPGAVFFMPYGSREFEGMGALAEEVHGLVSRMEEFKANTLKQLDAYIWMLADDQQKLSNLVDLMRASARENPADESVAQVIAEHDAKRREYGLD